MSAVHQDGLTDDHRAAFGLVDLADEVAGPILAGLRAQSVAALCERLGLAAILLDGRGRVLHVATRAEALLGGELSIVADHLLGPDEQANRQLGRLLTDPLSDPRGRHGSASFAPRAGEEPLVLTAVCTGTASPYQLLKVVLLATRGRAPGGTALRQVRSALADA